LDRSQLFCLGLGLEMQAIIQDATDYTQRYQRNNKRSGLKNLRCFPMCSDDHKLRGFCGRPVFVKVTNPEEQQLEVYATFRKLTLSDGEKPQGPFVNDLLDMAEVAREMRTKDRPAGVWMKGELDDGFDSASAPVVEFVVNKTKKGWHYGWIANKHTADTQHVLRVYITQRTLEGKVKVLHTVDTPPFTIFCRRRQRQKFAGLPEQLKIQLEIQGASKISKTSVPKSIPIMKKSAACIVDITSPFPLPPARNPATKRTSKREAVRVAAKRMKLEQLNAIAGDDETFDIFNLKGTGSKPGLHGKKVPKTSYDEKRTLLYHILRSLLRLDVKSAPNLQNLAQESKDVRFGGSDTDSVLSMEDFSKTISDCLGTITNGEEANAASSSTRSTVEAGSFVGDLASLQDFQPFDLDFTVLEQADVSQTGGGELKFATIMREFADFLLGEHMFTERIAVKMKGASLNMDSMAESRVAAGILLDMLQIFLTRFRITIDELYYLLKTQVWDKEVQEEGKIDPVTHPKVFQDAEHSFMQNVRHYTKSIKESEEATERQSPRGKDQQLDMAFPLVESVNDDRSETSASGMSSPSGKSAQGAATLLSLTNELLYVPDQDLRNNFTGTWVREEGTLNILESIRETIGVPYILRKMVRYQETEFKLSHLPNILVCRSRPKLFSSGFQAYLLDGKEHPWELPPPLPTERNSKNAVYQATLKNGMMRLVLQYNKKGRVVRELSKSKCNNRLESVVRFQFRDDEDKPWQTKVCASGAAKRFVGKEFNDQTDPFVDSDLVSWLSYPCDFTMSF